MRTIYVFDDDAYNYALEIGMDKITEIKKVTKGTLKGYTIVKTIEEFNEISLFPICCVLARPNTKEAENFEESIARLETKWNTPFGKRKEAVVTVCNDTVVPTNGYYKILETTKKEYTDASNGITKQTDCALMQYKSNKDNEFVTDPQWYRINALISDDTICPVGGDYRTKLRLVKSSINRVIYIEDVRIVNNHYCSKWYFVE
ncbi:hypothetical protein [Acetobacteroides hydrogenigenes]|uniref:Uncharacterized protein n=1 Tax=Acetobacteroides hydrogenigenes TaxID=979970 RepID=A0A4R2EPL2_9BACT|nr:hypothetical protein [Acetobacteroides hydrogenigenes]TCN70721.1 hypothetical protein CLV25_103245 [Acetobacteroides hydrogenigenes]